MVQLYDELKNVQSEVMFQEKECGTMENNLQNEKQKNDRLKDQVQSFKEKQSLCEKVPVYLHFLKEELFIFSNQVK